MKRRVCIAPFLLIAAASAPAQDYGWEQVDEVGVKYRVFKKLGRLPLKLGSSHPNLVARYEPAAEGDYIWGSKGKFGWQLRVYNFKAKPAKTAKRSDGSKNAAAQRGSKYVAHNFRDFVTSSKDPDNKDRAFRIKGKKFKKNKGKSKLPYTWWEYTDKKPMSNGYESFDQLWYQCAAVYDIGDREVAIVTSMPCKKDKLAAKHRGWATRMLQSVTLLKDKELEGETSKDSDLFKFAETEGRKAAVDKALANINNLDKWGIFTTPNYIVLYSWPKREKMRKFRADAQEIAAEMDKMRELYQEYYPPHSKMKIPYSVMRICSNGEEFHKYSENTGPGVIGWFSPGTKELVLFVGRRDVKTVAFHEGWHQYSNAYFGDAVELHRWFDEGHGDYFGSFTLKGKRWQYATSKMRKVDVKTLVSSKKYTPLNEIVTWNKDKFYGAKAALWYAQGYAIVDFLRNGSKRKGLWNPRWSEILEVYKQTMLKTKNQKKAVEAAFAQVDWERLDRAWVAWVKGY